MTRYPICFRSTTWTIIWKVRRSCASYVRNLRRTDTIRFGASEQASEQASDENMIEKGTNHDHEQEDVIWIAFLWRAGW